METKKSMNGLFVIIPVLPKKPSLKSSQSASTLLTGTKMTLTCATSSHGTVSYRFLLNNKEVYHGSHNIYTVPSNTATANSNSYTCKATISGAESVASGDVKVKFVGELYFVCIT